MVMVCIQVAVLPLPSVAVHIRVRCNSSHASPDSVSEYVRVTSPQASLAIGAVGPSIPISNTGSSEDPQLTVTSVHSITGGILSSTQIVPQQLWPLHSFSTFTVKHCPICSEVRVASGITFPF